MGVRSSLVARRGQQVVAGDRLADRIGIGVLAMVLFFQSGYGEVWNKLVAGLDWARQFRVRLAAGMQPSPAAVTYARQRLGWQDLAALYSRPGRLPPDATKGRGRKGHSRHHRPRHRILGGI